MCIVLSFWPWIQVELGFERKLRSNSVCKVFWMLSLFFEFHIAIYVCVCVWDFLDQNWLFISLYLWFVKFDDDDDEIYMCVHARAHGRSCERVGVCGQCVHVRMYMYIYTFIYLFENNYVVCVNQAEGTKWLISRPMVCIYYLSITITSIMETHNSFASDVVIQIDFKTFSRKSINRRSCFMIIHPYILSNNELFHEYMPIVFIKLS